MKQWTGNLPNNPHLNVQEEDIPFIIAPDDLQLTKQKSLAKKLNQEKRRNEGYKSLQRI